MTKVVPLAFVHHANQYLITNGYENRDGLEATVGSVEGKTGLAWILELHRRYRVPANIHFSGTLIEAIAWHQPEFFEELRQLFEENLLEVVGSCYGQNIMRFFSYEHNLKQLNEELRLYEMHLGINPEQVKTFWPPERVWDTQRMAAVVSDPRLRNRGYKYVLVDDRLFLPVDGFHSPRRQYDREQSHDSQLFQMYEVEGGHGLIALPIAHVLRQNIPPIKTGQLDDLREQLGWLSSLDASLLEGDVIAVYGDDMEKAAGLAPWDTQGAAAFETFLKWLKANESIRAVRISDCCATKRLAGTKTIDVGTFVELANHCAAGEGYEKWFFGPHWNHYRHYFSQAASRVNQLALCGADRSLIDLAEKHLLASNWETAWHTPAEGPFGDVEGSGQPSPWIRAIASHSRHAAVIAEAAHWMRHKDGIAHAYFQDIDSDSDEELIVKNDKLFAVFSARWGGRLVALFSIEGREGKMVVGNPSDDWNWMEELNRYMEKPANHPGAFADCGFENDMYAAEIKSADGPSVRAELCNRQLHSAAFGLRKVISLEQGAGALKIHYTRPSELSELQVEFGLSPDYLSLLREGRSVVNEFESDGAHGCSVAGTKVWVRAEGKGAFRWSKPYAEEFGHKVSLRLATAAKQFVVSIGVERSAIKGGGNFLSNRQKVEA